MNNAPQQLLSSANCYVCVGMSLAESLELALLAGIATAAIPPVVIPPVLSFAFPNLSWTFSGTNPGSWSIQESNDFGATWDEVQQVPGASRSAQFLDSGVLARIVGVSPSIAPSNSVVIP